MSETREEMAARSDDCAQEHRNVQADDPEWWLSALTSYGSLFLGKRPSYNAEARPLVPITCSQPLGPYKHCRVVSSQVHEGVTCLRATREGSKAVALAAARISRPESTEGHAL